jgi:uncharacterized protein (DUF2336 family)
VGSLVSVVAEVEGAIASGDQARRVTMLRRMTSLFTDEATRLDETQVAAFDEVILRLSKDIEVRARAELSDRLADVANAPRQTVRRLAFDEAVEVAGPVLERSSRISETDLVQIATERSQGHLMSLSRRASLSERVTDMIVVRGDEAVVRTVAGNGGARFSSGGFSMLTERAREDGALQDTLQKRRDVPPAYQAQLLVLAQERAKAKLAAEFDADAASAAIAAAATAVKKDDPALAAAIATVERRARPGVGLGIEETDVVAWVTGGQTTEALVALARMAGVPPQMAVTAFEAKHYDPLLFLVRSVRFGWGTLKNFIAAKNGGKTPDQDTIRSAFEAFQGLSVATAQRVVRFTAVRGQGAPGETTPNAA